MKKIISLVLVLTMFVSGVAGVSEVKVKAAIKSLDLSGQWVRGEDVDSTGYNEYRFTVSQSGLLKLNLIRYGQQFTEITNSEYKTIFSIENASCSKSDPSSVEREEYFDPGTYIIKIKTTDGKAYGDLYDIKAVFTTVNSFEKEPNVTYTSANSFMINRKYTGVIAAGDEADWFKVTVKSGIYIINMQTYGSIFYSLWDKDLVNKVAHNVWASGGDNNSPGIINTDVTLKAGTYYLQIVPVYTSAKYIMSLNNKRIAVPKIKSVKNMKGKKMKIVLSGILRDVSGYQIRYGTKKSMVKAKKSKMTDKNIVSKTIGKLKKKTYYVQVRAYEESGGYKAYSNWSKIKKVKIRK